jgi:hypothetical protein
MVNRDFRFELRFQSRVYRPTGLPLRDSRPVLFHGLCSIAERAGFMFRGHARPKMPLSQSIPPIGAVKDPLQRGKDALEDSLFLGDRAYEGPNG